MWLKNVIADRGGGVSVLAALSLVCVIGMGSFAVDLNRGYEMMVSNQRVADMAALAAGVAYGAAKNEAILQPTAQDLATVHGITGGTVVAKLVTDVPTPGAKAVQVTITMPLTVTIGRVLGVGASFPVSTTATASLATQTTAGCIVGLANSGNAIETQGGATINAPACTVGGVGTVANNGNGITAKNIISGAGDIVNNYGTLTADLLRYAGSFTNPDWNNNVPAADKRVKQSSTVSDPLADNLDLGSARSLLGTWRTPVTLANPTTLAGGAVWTFSSTPSAAVAGFRKGGSSNFTVPAGNYTIDTLSIGDSMTVTFSPGSTVTVARGVTIGASTVVFGDGIYRINGGFSSGSTGVTFGDGELSIGQGTVSFAGTNRIGNSIVTINAPLSIGGGATLTMGAGAHAFGGISVGGGSWLTLGAGALDVTGAISVAGDSTIIAGAGDVTLSNPGAKAIDLSGSGRFFMGDGRFSANGSIVTAGGSRLVFGKTANHLVNGDLSIAGSVLFGAGRYTVKGNFVNGTGGTTWPYTSPINNQTWGDYLEGTSVSGYDMAGVNVTFILSGTINLAGGAKTLLIAPATTTTNGAIADMLIDSLTSTDTNWSGGATSVFSGAVHLPNSALTSSGGNATQAGVRCFMLVAYRVTLTGGATAGSTCSGIGASGGGSGTVDLIS
ncbi:hypothetical protein [Sphingomonas sp. 8AM]|uniref:hypothetical protein n=1 Tax=Sphingomonas sp. 8AM TaxID=2653170 RepID=UPI0012F171ED|nr:hypothetical protein [Sphingomonas sp. 8AM]VXC69235.1 conserved hypothetical protein [Sphingomonas sp. 8AM]